ncbi:MAG TPA: DUF1571 domain-containing protein [Bacteroidia bacterium]|jgi:hypothetical protein|nr:DUF1571 domain-containing protein [Bacteroidia bacterium]
MRFLKLALFIVFPFFFMGTTPIDADAVSCREILNKMLDSIRSIKTQQYYLKSTERVDDRLLFAESIVKINVSPKKIYFQSIEKGIELLWVEGTNKGNAIVHAKSLPFMNLDLDPYGSVMRKNQHHTIFDLGFHYIGKTIATTILKTSNDFDKHFSYAGTLTWDNKECFQLLISYPEYQWIEHITKKGETVNSIAELYNTSDFKIRYKNDLSSYFGSIKEGKRLLIPVPYSNRAILFIDKKTYLPLNLKVYDEKGLFEAYEFYDIQINKLFEADEFSKSYKKYNF